MFCSVNNGLRAIYPFIVTRKQILLTLSTSSQIKIPSIVESRVQTPTEKYTSLVNSNKVKEDQAQLNALRLLDELFDNIIRFESRRENSEKELKSINEELMILNSKEIKSKEAEAGSKTNSWFYGESRNISLFGNLFSNSNQIDKIFSEKDKSRQTLLRKKRNELDVPKGLYIYGSPGSGKTYIMDLFYNCLPENIKSVSKRVHFNEFMLDVHRTLHRLQKKGIVGDEMMATCVTDIADAMIMKQLFTNLYNTGVITVMTSNRAPDELYKNGIQRDLFIPFIDQVKRDWKVLQMISNIDYRKILILPNKLEKNTTVTLFFSEKDPDYEDLWGKFTPNGTLRDPLYLNVQGRKLIVPKVSATYDVARFDFDDLCSKPLGPGDYAAIAMNFHTVFIDNIPQLNLNKVNQMRRFITLVDTLYDQNVVIVASSPVSIDEILVKEIEGKKVDSENEAAELNLQETDLLGTAEYVPSQGNVDEVFAMDRTLSRLHEMQQPRYLEYIEQRVQKQIEGTNSLKFFNELGDVKESMQLVFKRYDLNQNGVLEFSEAKRFMEEYSLYKRGFKEVSKDEIEIIVSSEPVDEEEFIEGIEDRRLEWM
eukprot:snap_masked-scaffold_14-processed-gene-10.37-mRNA-1 protein AED:0.49 eAED:0.49 QI:0/0/0/1/1/1/2/0/594